MPVLIRNKLIALIVLSLPVRQGWAENAGISAAYELINEIRGDLVLPAVEPHQALEVAAVKHARYLDLNPGEGGGLDAHTQEPGRPSFFSATALGRVLRAGFASPDQIAEVIASSGDPSEAVSQWLDTLYHRLPLINPRATWIGLGSSALHSVAVIHLSRRLPDRIVPYPYPGQQDVPPIWDGREIPDPLPHIDSAVGPTVTVTFPRSVEYRVESPVLYSDDSRSLPLHSLMPLSDEYIGNTVAFWSKEPLRADRTYRAYVRYRAYRIKIDSLVWSFRTGRLPRDIAVFYSTEVDNNLTLRFQARNSFDPVARAAYREGLNASKADDDSTALRELEAALEIDPQFTAALVLKADILERHSFHGRAAEVYEVLNEIEPGSDYLTYHLARAYMKNEEFDRALNLLSRLRETYGDNQAIEADIEYTRRKLGK